MKVFLPLALILLGALLIYTGARGKSEAVLKALQ